MEKTRNLPGLRCWREQQVVVEGRPFRMWLVEFDANSFGIDAYRAAAIALPPQIAGSVRKRQAEFFFGRLAARSALSSCGIAPGDIAIGANREPLWPAGVIGSISHSGDIAAALALEQGQRRGVGVDLEPLLGPDLLGAVRTTVLNEGEYSLLSSITAVYPIETLCTLAFSAKESFFKACFAAVKRYFDFSSVQIVGVDFHARTMQLMLVQTLCPALVAGQMFQVRFEFPRVDTALTLFVW